MTVATRRELLAGAAAGAVAGAVGPAVFPAAAGAVAAPPVPRATPEVVRRGRAIAVGARGRRVLVAHDRRRTVAITGRRSQVVDVGGQPVDVALSRDGRLGAVTTGFWDTPGVALLDTVGGTVLGRIAAGPAPGAVAFTARGDRLVVAGGEQEGTVTVIDVARRAVVREAAVGLVPRGLALVPGRDAAWVALNGEAHVVLVDLATGRVRRTLRTPALPDRIALDAAGRRLLITHGGPDASHVTELDLTTRRVRRHAAGRLPSAVAWTADGRRLVALGGGSQVVELGRRRARHDVGAAPRGLAVAGRRFWTVSAMTGAVTRGRA
jgi:DNA-binding beta-propeller fold protein YncE